MSAPFRFPKFFVTNPSPCPYLPGKVERKVFTELTGRHASELNEALGPHRLPPQPIGRLPPELHRLLRLRLRSRPRRRVRSDREPAQASTPPRRSRGQRVQAVDHRGAISAPSPLSRGPPSRAAGWPKWTRATSPTWSSRRRSEPTSSNIASRRPTAGPAGLSAPACRTSRATACR